MTDLRKDNDNNQNGYNTNSRIIIITINTTKLIIIIINTTKITIITPHTTRTTIMEMLIQQIRMTQIIIIKITIITHTTNSHHLMAISKIPILTVPYLIHLYI